MPFLYKHTAISKHPVAHKVKISKIIFYKEYVNLTVVGGLYMRLLLITVMLSVHPKQKLEGDRSYLLHRWKIRWLFKVTTVFLVCSGI